ncbi:MAG: hypothetical protein LC124_11370 [Ignavibacteriales bacterium]|nr:hypothetical protein [Ignavibacterium sp.]MCZ2269444.1 hypothetical protein [Ignavibacteriales bacterium]
MRAILFFCVTILFFSSCKNSSTGNEDTYAGEFAFEQRKLDITAEPAVALQDTTILLKVTCYPKYPGTGTMRISLGAPSSWVVLEYPYRDTLKELTEIPSYVNFESGNPFTQEWQFKLLRTFSTDYTFEVFARYDSIFIADSTKMYGIDSPELREITWVGPDGSLKWIGPSGLLQLFTLPKP